MKEYRSDAGDVSNLDYSDTQPIPATWYAYGEYMVGGEATGKKSVRQESFAEYALTQGGGDGWDQRTLVVLFRDRCNTRLLLVSLASFRCGRTLMMELQVAVDWEVISAKKEKEREDEEARAGTLKRRGPSSGMDREMK